MDENSVKDPILQLVCASIIAVYSWDLAIDHNSFGGGIFPKWIYIHHYGAIIASMMIMRLEFLPYCIWYGATS